MTRKEALKAVDHSCDKIDIYYGQDMGLCEHEEMRELINQIYDDIEKSKQKTL